MADALGEFSRREGFVEARLMRRLDVAPEALWRTLTEPPSLALWLAPGGFEPRVGGRARFDFADSGTVIDSAVAAWDTGRVVGFSWSQPGEPDRPVRWEIAAEGAGSRLTLLIATPDGEDPARACAGWEAHLAMLTAALAGAAIAFPFEVFKAAREAYRGKTADL